VFGTCKIQLIADLGRPNVYFRKVIVLLKNPVSDSGGKINASMARFVLLDMRRIRNI
jgi:hypothetical protein